MWVVSGCIWVLRVYLVWKGGCIQVQVDVRILMGGPAGLVVVCLVVFGRVGWVLLGICGVLGRVLRC